MTTQQHNMLNEMYRVLGELNKTNNVKAYNLLWSKIDQYETPKVPRR